MAIRPLGSISEYITDILVNGDQIDSFSQTGNADYDVSANSSISDPFRNGGLSIENQETGNYLNLYDIRPTSGVPLQIDVDITNVNSSVVGPEYYGADLRVNGNNADSDSGNPPFYLSATVTNTQTISIDVNMQQGAEWDGNVDISLDYQLQTEINASGVTQS